MVWYKTDTEGYGAQMRSLRVAYPVVDLDTPLSGGPVSEVPSFVIVSN